MFQPTDTPTTTAMAMVLTDKNRFVHRDESDDSQETCATTITLQSSSFVSSLDEIVITEKDEQRASFISDLSAPMSLVSKKVRFCNVIKVREFPEILSDNPGGSGCGPAVTIDWYPQDEYEAKLKDHEQQDRTREDFLLSKQKRLWLLRHEYTLREIVQAGQTVRRVQQERFISSRDNLWLRSTMESLRKKVKRHKKQDENPADFAALWLQEHREPLKQARTFSR